MGRESILQKALAFSLWGTVVPNLENRMNKGTLAETDGFEPSMPVFADMLP
jgi:hypothetical protein